MKPLIALFLIIGTVLAYSGIRRRHHAATLDAG